MKGAETLVDVQGVQGDVDSTNLENINFSIQNTIEKSALKLEASNGWSIFVLILSIAGIATGGGMIVWDMIKAN